ncbi:MAG: hypothetical protein QM775_36610 [Pirellulales bacterium]
MAFSCGGFLIGWGAVSERARLQELGMPIFLSGIVALVVGVLPIVMLKSLEAERKRRDAAELQRATVPFAPRRTTAQAAERRAA